ncbi:MucR family transcriptional regulator [Gulosibacter molinativorax]|uniref:Helix-turn-helix domain-containing protein n=1 Tax=Gulosibacter molinativorax TaxID=256821 RepID=A0ABT7CAJ8_9MICO|nr:MucR family transcriptional regulator [Gulosibacter molinativorax]MDJ1372219.1 hypothetical protein [Gulosibacter molinativorax]QUY60908.1 Hypotetical protein [Gulosibacter molinativorax]
MIVTLREAADELGFSHRTLLTYRQRRADFPAHVKMRGDAMLYNLDELRAYLRRDEAPAVSNKRAERHDDGAAITCLECGARRQSLAQHLQRMHGLTAPEYIERHNLPRTTALQSRHARSAHGRALTPQGRAQLSHRDQAARSKKAAEHTRVAHQRAGVPEVRAPGQAKGVAAMHARKRRVMDELVQALGYTDFEAAIRATAHLTIRGAARALGIGQATVTRWRRRYLAQETRNAPRPSRSRDGA